MKKMFAIMFAIMLMAATAMAQTSEPDVDPLDLFESDLCDEETVKYMGLTMAAFMAVMQYNEDIVGSGMTLDEFVEAVIDDMMAQIEDMELDFEYCNVTDMEFISCKDAAQAMYEIDGFDPDEVQAAMAYLGVTECVAAIVLSKLEDSDIEEIAVVIGGMADGYWMLLNALVIPDEEEK